MGQPYVLFFNIVAGLYGALRFCGWLIVWIKAFEAEKWDSEKLRALCAKSTEGMAKGCLWDFLIIAWWITYFVAVRR